ncbi:hypothetical protein [Actinomadura rugatobispora]|uniref:Uncharacterized protein n=1 Tax=Actinomadura rugatobispora TaxID=1994 RepID=A0ABW0ZV20_9ACTN|nr:hypothetical protein GCM10010200_035810 [Actinomadura rugatobispora]
MPAPDALTIPPLALATAGIATTYLTPHRLTGALTTCLALAVLMCEAIAYHDDASAAVYLAGAVIAAQVAGTAQDETTTDQDGDAR